jgi:hypothetical protein
MTDRDVVIARINTWAFDVGRECQRCKTCPDCGGARKVHDRTPADLIVHCLGSFSGANWNAETVIQVVRDAATVEWVDGMMGHDLQVMSRDGRLWRFQIPRPGGESHE